MLHLHAHIKPRYLDEADPRHRISGQNAGERLLDEVDYQQRIQAIAAALQG